MTDTTVKAGYAGAARAAAHADRVHPEWEHRAYRECLDILADCEKCDHVTTPLLRFACTNRGLPLAPDARAWGNITRRLVREHKLRDTGVRVRLGSHGREIPVWEVL
jgi:hypothetical protein